GRGPSANSWIRTASWSTRMEVELMRTASAARGSAVADFSAASSELPGSLQANVYRSVGRLPAAAS
ncbi:MAG: hypothetical protein ACRDOG_15580, partial [Gaiellaceae bacterium]